MALLKSTQPLWHSVTGTVSSWFDEDLLDIGRARYWRTKHPGADHPNEENRAVLGTLEGLYRFWATASPWQLRLETLREVISPDRENGRMPDVLIADRWTWWAKRGNQERAAHWPPDRVIVDREGKRWVCYGETVMPDPGHRYRSHGLENLDLLLKPASFTRAFTFPAARRVEEGGRPSIRLDAVPRRDEEFQRWVPGLVALGSDSYVITIDAATGIVLDVRIDIEGQVARRHTIGHLQVDVPIDGTTFIQPRSVDESV